MGYLMDDLIKYDFVGYSVFFFSVSEFYGEWMEVKRKVRLVKKKEVRVCFKNFFILFLIRFWMFFWYDTNCLVLGLYFVVVMYFRVILRKELIINSLK